MSIYDCHNRSPFWFGEPNCENPQADEPVTLIPLYGPDPKLQGRFGEAAEERERPAASCPMRRSLNTLGNGRDGPSGARRNAPAASAHPMPVASGGGAPGGGGEGPPGDGRQSPQKVCYFLFRRRRPASHVLPWWVHNPVLSVNGTRFCKASKSGRSISHTNKLSDNAPEKCDSTAA